MPLLKDEQTPEKAATNSSVIGVNWQDFREHLSTADREGRRKWLYPKKPAGKFYRYRTYVSWLLLAIMFIGPFIKINGNPLLLVNIVQARFSILGKIFWPQDFVILAVAMLVFLTAILMFTTAFGRLWCGWTCPQTLLMEMVFRKIEYFIEGDAFAQKALKAAPWTFSKYVKVFGKHGVFFVLSFVIANTLLSYIIGIEQLATLVTDNPLNHLTGLSFMVLFTLLFYAIFARFREQACTFICPYGRFQSVLIDENTMVVAYDYKRGEARGSLKGTQSLLQRKADGLGDCVNCRQCVSVCPTGIDIRDGTQMECVNCTACIDACDAVMDKICQPRGLIRYASLNSIEKGKKFRFTSRMGWYSVVLTALVSLFMFLILTRSEVETTFLRAPGALFQVTPQGTIKNLYTVKMANKTSRDIPIEMKLENITGRLTIMGRTDFQVPREKLAQTSILIELKPEVLTGVNTPLKVGIYSNGKHIETVKTVFAGPRNQGKL